MSKLIDLTGQRFGHWTVIERVANGQHGQRRWLCQCVCGMRKDVQADNLRSRCSTSCGCQGIDLTGQRFGAWYVVGRARDAHRVAYWDVRCDCGTERVIAGSFLLRGKSKACKNGVHQRKHGHASGGKGSRTYNSWCSMWQRCTDPNANNYNEYGGSGITVCERWRSFENFLADMSERPADHSIHRLDGALGGKLGYQPSNCTWEPITVQNRNKRNNIYVDAADVRNLLTALEYAERDGQRIVWTDVERYLRPDLA